MLFYFPAVVPYCIDVILRKLMNSRKEKSIVFPPHH